MGNDLKVLIGRRFGKLTVVKRGRRHKRYTFWVCCCDCGNNTEKRADSLLGGRSKSCGCGRGLHRLTHGLSTTRSYRSYSLMIDRCYNKSNIGYINYGGRGIGVCLRWRESFNNFYRDMGERPAGMTLGRKDNDGDYELSNCRWETTKQQNSNKRNTVYVEWNGERVLLIKLCEKLNLNRSAIYGRLINGWSIEKAIETKVRIKLPKRPQAEINLDRLWRRMIVAFNRIREINGVP